jgi:hypothetical protein
MFLQNSLLMIRIFYAFFFQPVIVLQIDNMCPPVSKNWSTIQSFFSKLLGLIILQLVEKLIFYCN